MRSGPLFSGLFESDLEVGEFDLPALGHHLQYRAAGLEVIVDYCELDLSPCGSMSKDT
jgi:hypothetical protein